jgi:hypothetical protein
VTPVGLRAEPTAILEAARWGLRSWRGRLPAEALEDLAQEAVIRALAPGVETPRGFAVIAGRRLAIDHYRRLRARPHVELRRTLSGGAGGIDEAELWMDLRVLERALMGAPPRHAEILHELIDTAIDAPRHWDDPLERDRWYKRRDRALAWARCTLEAA